MEIKQVALITGVGKDTGIGFEAARQLAQLGYRVIVTARKQATAEQLSELLRQEGLDIVPLALDVADESAVKAAAATLPKGGPTGQFFKDGAVAPW